MPAPLTWSVHALGGNLLVRVCGTLDRSTAPPLRAVLLKSLAQHPDAVLVDLAMMILGDSLALSVFPAVARQAARWPSIPVVFCAPSPAVAAALDAPAYRGLVVHPSVTAATAALSRGQGIPPSISDDLLPVRGAAGHARNLATDACVRWELPGLVWPASLVASELVSNAVQHAQTMVSLRFSLRPRYLLVAARDGSPDEPVLRPVAPTDVVGRRGLLLVQALAAHWGFLPTGGGKVVWATLAIP